MFDSIGLSCGNLYLVFLVPAVLLSVVTFALLEMGKIAVWPIAKRGTPVERDPRIQMIKRNPEEMKKMKRFGNLIGFGAILFTLTILSIPTESRYPIDYIIHFLYISCVSG